MKKSVLKLLVLGVMDYCSTIHDRSNNTVNFDPNYAKTQAFCVTLPF